MKTGSTGIFIANNNPHCEGRGVDAARLLNYFAVNHCKILDRPDGADFIIIFTCGFSNAFEDYYLDLINRFTQRGFKGEIIVTGCLPAIAPAQLSRVFSGKFFTTCDLQDIDTIFPRFETRYADTPDANSCHFSDYTLPESIPQKAQKLLDFTRKTARRFEWSGRFFRKGLNFLKTETTNHYQRHRSQRAGSQPAEPPLPGIRISNGCRGNCSYCGIRKAVGRLISKSPETCLSEYRRLLEKGHRHFVIGSEDTGAYGLDIGTTLPKLLTGFCDSEHDDEARWYLTSLKPAWLLKYKEPLIELARAGRISHLECPVQSASERILDQMHRPVDMRAFTEALTSIRQACPDIELITHVIVGFPSETGADFRETMALLETNLFQAVLLNPYDEKPRTAAVRIEPKVSADTIARRCEIVRDYMQKAGISPFRPRLYVD